MTRIFSSSAGTRTKFCFCEELEYRVTTASNSVTWAEHGSGKAAFDTAKEALQEGKDLITLRQKQNGPRPVGL